MNNTKYILWSRRRDFPTMNIISFVVLMILTVGLSSLTPLGYGGMVFTSFAGIAFGILLCGARNPFVWASIPLTYLISYILTEDLLASAVSLLYVPAGIVLAYAAFTKRNLSVTTVLMTVTFLITMAISLCHSVTQTYGLSLYESARAFGSDIKSMIYDAFSLITYPVSENEMFSLSSDDINALTEQTVMLLPSVIVLTCEAIAYGSAKLFCVCSKPLGYGFLFKNREWKLTLSTPAGVILIASLVISLFSSEAGVITYAAINMSYIIMPIAAVAGFHELFRKGGLLRRPISRPSRIFMIVSMVVIAMMSPLAAVEMLSVFGCTAAIARSLTEILKKKRDKDDTPQ